MKPLPAIASLTLLAACSTQPATSDNATASAAATAAALDNAEEVPVSEGDVVPTAEDAAQNGATRNRMADPDAWSQDRYVGRWKGVEGMYLTVTEKPDGRGVALDMQWDLDNKGKFDGSVTAEGLRFTRGGAQEIAVPSDGDATGLKYLAGKKDCLTVKPGEGYCRD